MDNRTVIYLPNGMKIVTTKNSDERNIELFIKVVERKY